MQFPLTYPTTSRRQKSGTTAPKLASLCPSAFPSDFDPTVTTARIDDAIFRSCEHSKKQLQMVLAQSA